MFLLTTIKSSLLLFFGGLMSSILATYCIHIIQLHTTLKKDTVLGIVLATSFGLGIALLSKIQTLPHAHQSGLTKFLLGNPAAMLEEDITMIIIASIFTLFIIFLYLKPYTIMIFDNEYAKIIGVSTNYISFLIMIVTTITIVIGLQTVGIILISSLLITPPAAAYQWTKNIYPMLLLSSFFGICSTFFGTIISCSIHNLPTGPVIVIVATIILLFSIFFNPNGIIIEWWKRKQQILLINNITMLSNFLLFNEGLNDPYHPHNLAALKAIGKQSTKKVLKSLMQQGLIESKKNNFWNLTPKGFLFLKQHVKDIS